jgi:oligopeptide transport system substrate-binding protein
MRLKQWRYLLPSLLAIAALAAFAACGDDEKDTGGTATPTEKPAGGRIDGGELIAATIEGENLDPHQSSFATEISFERMLWRGPYTMDAADVPQPAMAEELPEISADGLTYTITLKEGLLWSDGDDLLAEDFVMAILRTCNPVIAGEYQYVLSNVVGCDAHYGNEAGFDAALEAAVGVKEIDDLTYEITLANPSPTFTIILSMWVAFPVPVHLFPNSSDEWPAPGPGFPAALAYNGPYIVTEYEPGDHTTLAPNPNWVGDVKPTLATLTLRFIDDFAVSNRAYEADELDFTNVNLPELTSLREKFEPTGEYIRVLKPTTVGMEMNLERPPLDNLDVRLALVRADDHDLENKVCYQGGRVPSTSWLPAVIKGGAEPDTFEDVIGYDPVKAREHLTAAGYKNADNPGGLDFPVLTILVRDDTAAKCLAERHQELWRTNLGIETDIEIVDSPTRSARFKAEDFDLFPGGWVQDYPDPENWIIGLFDTDGGNNHYNCSDPEIDAKIAEAQFNTNEDERIQLYSELNELIVTRVCGIGPFMHVADHYLIKPYVVGMGENSTGQDGVIAGDWFAEAWGRSE